jgi:hypothetical protein
MRGVAKLSLALGGVLVMGASVGSAAPPLRKPGLWAQTMTLSGSKLPPQTSKLCVDAKTSDLLLNAGQTAANQSCSKHDIQMTGAVMTVDTVCRLGSTTLTSHARTSFSGDSAYHTDVTTHSDPPIGKRPDSSMAIDGHWEGQCPADMRPGDVMTAFGVKMHLGG